MSQEANRKQQIKFRLQEFIQLKMKNWNIDALGHYFNDNDFISVNVNNKGSWGIGLTKQQRIQLLNGETITRDSGVKLKMYDCKDENTGYQFFLNDSNIYCLDVDKHNFNDSNVIQNLYQELSFLKSCPFTLSRTKALPHFYFRIEGIESYSEEVNIMNCKSIEADLLHRAKQPIERADTSVYCFNNKCELPTFQWDDIKQYFNVDKMNFRTTSKPSIESSNKSSTEGIQSCISQGIESSKEGTNYEGDKKKWFDLAMICAKHNILYKYPKWSVFGMILKNELGDDAFDLFHDISKVTDDYNGENDEKKYKGLNDCLKYWNSIKIKKNDEKKYTFGTLIMWAKDATKDNKDEFNQWSRKYTKGLIQDEKDESYEAVKEEFEKNHFKVRYPLMFIQENEGYFEHCYKTKKAFLDAYENKPKYNKISKKGELERVSLVNDWVKDEFMREYEKADFMPYGPTQEYKENKNIFNTFTGYEINKNTIQDVEDIDMTDFIDYFLHLCGNNWSIYEFFRNYISHILKYPSDKTRVACVIKSNQGCGKGTLAEILTAIFGSKYIFEDTGITAFTDRFNSATANKLIGIIDEAKSSDGFSNPEKIKKIISDKTQWIEPKGGEKYEISSHINLIFFTNNDVVVKIESSDRRFQLWTASNKYQNNTHFFTKLREKYIDDKKGLYAVYKWFLNSDVEQGYDFSNNRVITEEYKQNQALQIPPIIKFFEDIADSIVKTDILKFKPNELFNDFKRFCSSSGFKIEPNVTRFGLDMNIYCKAFAEKKKTSVSLYYFINYDIMIETLKKYEVEKIEFVDE